MIVHGINERILFEQASQRLTFECPQGRPDAEGSVSVFDTRYDPDDTSRNPIVSGTANRVAIDTYLNAGAGPTLSDPRNVPLAAADVTAINSLLIVDEDNPVFLWLENSQHQKERVQLAKKGTTWIGVAEKLTFDYPSGSRLYSAVMHSPVLPTAFVSDEKNLGHEYYATWTYAVDGVTYTTRSRWVLTREIPDGSVADSVLLERFPDLKRFAFKDHPDTFLPLVKAAERDVDALLWRLGIDPNRLRSNERLRYLVEMRAHVLIAQNGLSPGKRAAEEYVARKEQEWDEISDSVTSGFFRMPYDENEDDVANEDAAEVYYLVR